jgi:lipoyl(octanoyl) transferase
VTWVWDDRVPRDGATQMALDTALQARAAADGTIVLRLYRWASDTVSFGANEAAARHWSRPALEADGVPCVRRPTGGRAVWHAADDLTYAWTGPVALLGGQRAAYAALHRELADALAPVVGAATLAEAPARLPGLAAGACFDVPVGGEVLVGGRKVIGSAQLIRDGALLQHGAVARRPHAARLAPYAAVAPATDAVTTPSLASADTLAEAISAGRIARGAIVAPPELTAWAEQVSVEGAARFRDPAWTWRR